MVAAVADLTSDVDTERESTVSGPADSHDSPFFVREIAEAVGGTSAHASQRDELTTATFDLFADRQGPAAEWLISICGAFVVACSLGLESTLANALTKVVGETVLVLDTDVVLSLLCEGEPDHAAVDSIARRWRGLGGKLFVANPVIHEVAYHAGIAEYDYSQVGHWLPGTEEERLRLIDNAFVRAFGQLVAEGKAKKGQWARYIKQYKGTTKRDSSLVRAVLQDLHMSPLRAASSEEAGLQANVSAYLQGEANRRFSGTELRNGLDKARRDAELYASIVRKVRQLRETEASAGCLLVSSARRLSDVDARFRESEEVHFVVPISAIVYVLALIPEVSLGLSALKSFLFDQRRVSFTSDMERSLLRIIKDSNEFSIPWARRTTLRRELREKLLQEALASAREPTKESVEKYIQTDAFKPGNAKRTSEIIREALDQTAVDTRLEEENRELRRRIAELEAEKRDMVEQSGERKTGARRNPKRN